MGFGVLRERGGIALNPGIFQELEVDGLDVISPEDLQLSAEDLIRDGDLRSDFVDGSLLPAPASVELSLDRPFVVRLRDDCRVQVPPLEGVASKMSPRGVLLLNILMLHQGEVSYEELDRLETLEHDSRSPYPSPRIHVRAMAPRALWKLSRAVEFTETGCRLADNLFVIDERTKPEAQTQAADGAEQVAGSLVVGADFVVVAREDGDVADHDPVVEQHIEQVEQGRPPFTVFESQVARLRAFSATVRQYQDHPQVGLALAELRSDERARHTLFEDARQQYAYESKAYVQRLATDEKESLFLRIERGMGVVRQLQAQGDADPSSEQEQQLIGLTIAANTLVMQTLNLVPSHLDRKFAKHRQMRDELLQEGDIGLWKAVMSFDYTQGSEKFISYAMTFIDRSITSALARERRAGGMSDDRYKQWAELQRTRVELLKNLKRDPTNEELATKLGVSMDELTELDNSGVVYVDSLDEKLDASEEHSAIFGDNVADESAEQAFAQVERGFDAPYILNLVTKAELPARDQLLISLFYGVYMPHLSGVTIHTGKIEVDYDTAFEKLKDVEKVSNRDVALVCGLAESSANTLKYLAMKRVRETLAKSPDLVDAQILGGSWKLSEMLPDDAVAALREQWGLAG